MRPLEIAIPVLLVAYSVWPVVTGRRRPVPIEALPPLALVLAILHPGPSRATDGR